MPRLTGISQLLNWIIALALERISDNKSWDYKAELNNLISEIFKESFGVFEKAITDISVEEIDELFRHYTDITKKEIDAYEKDLNEYGKQAVAIFQRYDLDKTHFVRGTQNWLWKLAGIYR
jgi:hypothetical protein